MDKKSILDEIFKNDPFGMLDVKPVSSGTRNEEERLLTSFQPILDFYKKYNREPQPDSSNIQEHTLSSRLKSIRESSQKIALLKVHDTFGLLNHKVVEINSIDDIFYNNSFGLLDDDLLGLFDFKHIEKPDKDRMETDFVARRKPCKDFDKYENRFRDIQQDLKDGKRKTVKFHENQIQEGAFFILNGILVLVNELIGIKVDKFGKRDGRTKLIFENGTESNMLFRSLGKGLFQNGQGITFTDSSYPAFSTSEEVNEEDQPLGYIYILKSKSINQKIREIENLYKIGFSKNVVEERIKNAKEEPTYLMAAVKIVETYQCYNMNPQKLEQLLHNFFGKACLNIDIFDNEGNRHTPREWFIAPLSIIEQAIHLILSGEILGYRYDMDLGIVGRG